MAARNIINYSPFYKLISKGSYAPVTNREPDVFWTLRGRDHYLADLFGSKFTWGTNACFISETEIKPMRFYFNLML